MTISVLSAAKVIGVLSGWSKTHLQLQKIIYLNHMVCLWAEDEPLVQGGFEAWDFGPVHPELYAVAKIFGSSPVRDIFHNAPTVDPNAREYATLKAGYEKLGHLTGGQLVHATHRPGGAWESVYVPGIRHIPISNEAILEEYKRLHARKAEAA
jgi:uncharacterized phage-associated protein